MVLPLALMGAALMGACVRADIAAQSYGNTALAGVPTWNGTVQTFSDGVALLEPNTSMTFEGQLSLVGWSLLSLEGDGGFARLWVDDHLLIDGTLDAPASPPCEHPGGDPTRLDGYRMFNADLPTTAGDDPHSMRHDGGDCTAHCSATVCAALCRSLASKGCVGFVTMQNRPFNVCYMRKLAGGNCSTELVPSETFASFVLADANASGCAVAPNFCPGASPHSELVAKYAIPIPFLPGAAAARFRLEITSSGSLHSPTWLRLLSNGTEVPASVLGPTVAPAELQYQTERAAAEVGWNTWLSGDMLTHALLPHGIAVSLALHVGPASVQGLGGQGPSCDTQKFPAEHGLHAVRGEYTEIARVTVGSGVFRVETATVGERDLDMVVVITTLASIAPSVAPLAPSFAAVTLGVPAPFAPRVCDTRVNGTAGLRGDCPGIGLVHVRPLSDHASATAAGLELTLPSTVGGQAALLVTAGGGTSSSMVVAEAVAAVVAARARLVSRYSKFGTHNETFAGMSTAIAWNVIYTPYEGIFTPVFRGSPWSVSKPHNYVLFEWDTYMASIIAVSIDPWVARSNIIRMTKSLIFKGFVAGFWNGLCGEVDKSKPPVGSVALEFLVQRDASALWLVDLLLPQMLLWNRWWAQTRQFGLPATSGPGSAGRGQKNVTFGLLAPGSTRQNIELAIACTNQPPLVASRCETGLDNSPLYDDATFDDSEDVIDSVDVGMSALYARDAQSLAWLAREAGYAEEAIELVARGDRITEAIADLWNPAEGVYLNRLWQSGQWAPRDGKTQAAVVGPPNFYPMIARAPNVTQVNRMIARFLSNVSEFGVTVGVPHGLPSISRSSSAFNDNSYWRGRTWGPMNFLIYLGLSEYDVLPAAKQAMQDLARQSEATFLIEWNGHHRVMENYNSVTGEGCDVGNAIPFYHWGALTALIALMDAGLVP